MAKLAEPNWALLTEATYPLLSPEEREVLRKIWATNYANFAPLKAQVNSEMDPDPVFDILGEGSLG